MSVIFGLDTSGETITLCLKHEKKTYYSCLIPPQKKHNSVLLNAIDEFLKSHFVKLQDIDYFGVVIGPGSFTGIRIAVSTINAFAFAFEKKIVEVTSFEPYFDGSDKLVLIDCKHDNFYVGKYVNGEVEYLSMNKAELENIALPKEFINKPSPEKILMAIEKKVTDNIFVLQSTPFYLKKSSAERV